MKSLKSILSEFSLRSFPDWNRIQVRIFKELKKDGDLTIDDIRRLAKVLRDHMNDNYFSGVWNVDKSEDDLFVELINLSRKSLGNHK